MSVTLYLPQEALLGEDLFKAPTRQLVNTKAIADNFNPESLALTEPVPLTMHPAEVYLNSLREGSRRTMREALNAIAQLARILVKVLAAILSKNARIHLTKRLIINKETI